MAVLCNDLSGNVAAIVSDWKRLTNKPPWSTMPERDWVDYLPPLLTAMINGVICQAGSHDARRTVVERGTIHGEHRRAHGFSVEDMFEEAALLRRATWNFLTNKVESVTESGIVGEILRLDAAISVATLAGMAGFHKVELERANRWDSIVDRLLAHWEETSLMEKLAVAPGAKP
ncbi:MAG TPA: hypothetical protein VIP11_02000 [Gemmatimonadaceae bacterium]